MPRILWSAHDILCPAPGLRRIVERDMEGLSVHCQGRKWKSKVVHGSCVQLGHLPYSSSVQSSSINISMVLGHVATVVSIHRK